MMKLLWRKTVPLLCNVSVVLVGLNPMGANASSCTEETSRYAVQGDQIWFHSTPPNLSIEVKGIDKATFRDISPYSGDGPCGGRINDYARDKAHVVYRGNVLAGVDPDSFVFMDGIYTKDKSAVYSGAIRLTNRVAEFHRLPTGVWGTDGLHYFYEETIFEGEGFEKIPNGYKYARTSSKVYNGGKALMADPGSFEVIQASVGMTKDKSRVYYRDTPIAGADPATIVQINGYLFKDKRAVYLEGREIVGLNPATAKTYSLGSAYTADDVAVYRMYTKIARDPATFRVLQPFYTVDRNAVYHNDVAIERADPETFVSTSMSRAYDKNYRYREDRIECKVNPAAVGLEIPC